MKLTFNKLALEPYKHSGKIKTNITSGFASVSQKDKLVGLKVLIDAIVTIGNENKSLYAGDVVYISEEVLHNNPWSQKTYEFDGVNEKFILVDFGYVSMVEYKHEPK